MSKNPVENLTVSTEDYLKVIYELGGSGVRVSTNQVAERLRVKAASVTGMLQKMASAEPPLVDYQKHHGAILTPTGQTAALEVIRHHRLLELFLSKFLGYSWDEVHFEADRLEHVISEEMEERISQALGDPRRDPHGEPIPTRDFQLPPHSALPLSALRPGQQAVVERVENANPELLRYLAGMQVVPQARIRIINYSPFDGNLSLQVNGGDQPVVLGPQVTQQVFVELVA